MSPDEIADIAKRLDAGVPKENAAVRLNQYGGDGEDGSVIATRAGYLRLGIEFLKAGSTAPKADEGDVIDVELQYLIDDDSTITFSTFDLVEELETQKYEESWGGKIFICIIVTVLIAMPILAIIGLIALIRMLL